MVEARKSALNFDTYCFERALSFISIHQWVNSKRTVDQSERDVYFFVCYKQKYFLNEKNRTDKPDIPLNRWTIRKMVTIFNLANMSC